MKPRTLGLYSFALQFLLLFAMRPLSGLARADALDNWTPAQLVTNPIGYMGFGVGSVAYGNGRYVAVGQYASGDPGVVQTSTDGTNWVMFSYQDSMILDLYDVAFGNGTFVAVGWDYFGGNNLYNSTNGTNWTSHHSLISNFYRVIYGGGLFVAVGDGLLLQSSATINRNIYTSPDGITWAARNSGSPANDVPPIRDVAYGAGRFVAVDGGTTTANHFYTSTTGSTWTRTSRPGGTGVISFCNGLFVVPAGPGTNLLSTDGVLWAFVTNTTATAFARVVYADGFYLAFSVGPKLFTSTDGTNWTQRAAQIPSNVTLGSAAYVNRRFLAVGSAYPPSPVLPMAYFSDPTVALTISSGLPPNLQVSGVLGRSYRVEKCDTLPSTNWQPLTNFTLAASPTTLTDTQATNAAGFYRAVLLP
jgi:hypothetical protein